MISNPSMMARLKVEEGAERSRRGRELGVKWGELCERVVLSG